MSPEQIQRLRELAKKDDLFCAEQDELDFALPDLFAIADAYRWRPVGELTYEDHEHSRTLVFAKWDDEYGGIVPDTGLKIHYALYQGYTHFLRLPKLEAL